MKSQKQLTIFGKQKSTKVLQIFAFQKIASGIDAEALKCSSASIPDAIWPDCWTHYIDPPFLHILFSNSIDHILFAKPFFMIKKNIPLRKLEFEYFKDDLKKYGIDIYKLLEGCLF